MSLISKIQSLISSANAVTGESRTDLTSAVQDLKDGYGGGGLPIMEQYEVIVDTAMNNGEQTKNWFAGLIQDHSDSFPIVLAYLVYVGTNPVDRQLMAFMWRANTSPVTYPDDTLPTPYRWQSNAFYKTQASGGYDTNVNVGDKYILILFKAELFDL